MSEPSVPKAGVPTCYRHPGRETYVKCQRCERPICPDCMRDAAVGFQCPGCVAEGAKSTRAGRAAYGGQRSADPTRTTIGLIAINALVWLAVIATGARDSWLLNTLRLLPEGRCAVEGNPSSFYRDLNEAGCAMTPDGVWFPGLADGSWWMVLTHGFMHVDIFHIALNLLGLWVLGPPLEAAVGRVRFLAIYLTATLFAGATIFWLAAPDTATLGASGGVWGLIGALAVLSFKVKGDLRGVMTLLAVNLVFTFTFPGISWQGHLGGLAGGALATALVIWAPRGKSRGAVQAAGFVCLGLLLTVAFLTRAAMLA